MAESYTLEDFTRPGWIERDEYCDGTGIGIDHVCAIHAAEGDLVESVDIGGLGFLAPARHKAFVHLANGLSFSIYIYEVVAFYQRNIFTVAPASLWPAFLIMGRTFEGATEVRACPDNSPMPEQIIQQMQWALDYLERKGWTGEAPAQRGEGE